MCRPRYGRPADGSGWSNPNFGTDHGGNHSQGLCQNRRHLECNEDAPSVHLNRPVRGHIMRIAGEAPYGGLGPGSACWASGCGWQRSTLRAIQRCPSSRRKRFDQVDHARDDVLSAAFREPRRFAGLVGVADGSNQSLRLVRRPCRWLSRRP